MSVTEKHPLFTEFETTFKLVQDCYKGEQRIKDKGQEYLPATASQRADGMEVNQPGYLNYKAYRDRAIFHEFVKDAVDRYQGILHQKPYVINLPTRLQPLLTRATKSGESLEQLIRRITEEQLVPGRVGLVFDIDSETKEPYITLYTADRIPNWGETAGEYDFVVIDESGYEREGFQWKEVEQYRVLRKDSGVYTSQEVDGSFSDLSDATLANKPKYFGKGFNKIPFVFINSKDTASCPDIPPLASLARISVSIYKSEADYRQSLYMQGQDTLVVIGGRDTGEATRVGAGAKIDVDLNGDAKYIGVSSSGLSEQRQALESDKNYARYKAGHLIQTGKTDAESGKALQIRVGAQVATLTDIARTAAAGLVMLLRMGAEWLGESPDAVEIVPNLDFTDIEVDGQNLVQLQSAKSMGLPLSRESIHNILREKGLTTFTLEEEIAKIEAEGPLGATPPAGPGSTENQPGV